MLLAPHFSLEEFTLSSTALALGIDNTPTPVHLENLNKLDAATNVRDSAPTFDQLIHEKNRCVHFSAVPQMRRQILRRPGGPGLPVHRGLESQFFKKPT